MNEFIEQITREDVYHVVTPLIVCILSGVMPLITFITNKFAKNWRCEPKKSESDAYGNHFLWVIIIGIPFMLFVAILFGIANALLGMMFGVGIPIETGQKMLPILCIIMYLCMLIKKVQLHEEYCLVRGGKMKKIFEIVLKYFPFLIGMWIWGFSIFIESSFIDGLVILGIILCEGLACSTMDTKKKYPYVSTRLVFADGSEAKYAIECVRQKGNWIIAEDTQNSCETRYRKEDLVKVIYFNEEPHTEIQEIQENTEEAS